MVTSAPVDPGDPMTTQHVQDLDAERSSISTPDTVPSPLGDLTFSDGLPMGDTVGRAYDLLDLTRAIEVYLNTVPGVSLVAMRRGVRSIGMTSPRVLGHTNPTATSTSFYLTPNTETTYGHLFLDLAAEGPTVVEIPPHVLGVLDDFWFRYITDLGMVGPDRGAGGRYLVFPPGDTTEAPDGYYAVRSPTYTVWLMVRVLGGVPDLEKVRTYPLADAADPPSMTYLDLTDLPHNTVHSNDARFYDEVAELVSEEPAEAVDPERAGQLAALGIAKGRPFAPDERMRGILAQAAPIAAGIARAIVFAPREPEAYLWPDRSWKTLYPGHSHEFLDGAARMLDARLRFHYQATVITPAMAAAMVGAGSQYAYTAQDVDGDWLDGGRHYRLHLPPHIPAANFWAVDVYDTQTRSLLVTEDPRPAVNSQTGTVVGDDDAGTDIFFGPTAPEGREGNWVRTVPGKAWFPYLRLYGPLQPWFDGTWKPDEIVRVG
jgi:hypothetical protein